MRRGRQGRAGGRFRALALPLALALAAPAIAPGAAPAEARPKKHQLSNGLEVFIFEDARLPAVSCRLVLEAGSAHETPAQAGLAALTARALLLGTAARDGAALRGALEAVGGEMSASASYDYSIATLRTHARHFPRLFELFGEVVTKPAFPAAEWEALRARAVGESRQAGMDARRAADRHLGALLFGSTAYGRPLEGDPVSLQALTPEDARRFHGERWLPQQAYLAVAGDVRAAEILPLAERAFGAWKRGTDAVPIPVEHAGLGGNAVRLLDAPALERIELRIGLEGPGRGHPDHLAAAALHLVLAGNRERSRLREALRERGAGEVDLASSWSFGRTAGSLVLAAQTPPAGARAVLDAYREAAAALRTAPVTAQELETARRMLRGAAAAGQETPGDRAERWLLALAHGEGEDYLERFEARVRALEPADLQRVARRYLRGDTLAVVAVGPRDALHSQLADLAAPRVLPLGARTGSVPAVAIPLDPSPTADTPERRARGRAVADSAVAAHGGAAALGRAETWRAAGTITIGDAASESSGPFAEIFAWPDRWRTEMVIGGGRVVRTLDGEAGWSVTGGSVTDLEPETAAGLHLTSNGLPLVLLRRLAAPEASLLYVGREVRDDRPVQVVDWLRQDGGYTRVYFDAETYLLAAAEQLERSQEGGAPIPVLRLYQDTRPVRGLVHPFVTVLYAGNVRAVRQSLENLEIGVPVSPETFRPPPR